MVQLEAFPFISEVEFSNACQAFVEELEKVYPSSPTCGWESLGLRHEHGQTYVRITRILDLTSSSDRATQEPPTSSTDEESELDFGDAEDLDDAALRPIRALTPQPYVEYHILISPSYRVPVLYFFLRHLSLQGQPALDIVYKCLVPSQLRSGLQDTGPIGGISMSEHPIFGVPAFHVHPCNTAAAMEEIGGGQGVGSKDYLQIWVGLIGGHVGLTLPFSLS